MKRIIFLIIASLMVMGLVLPGCGGGGGGGGGGGATDVINIQGGPNGPVVIGICADSGHTTGDFNKYGIMLAAGQINAAGGINISGNMHNLTYSIIDTDEATEQTGAYGKIALEGAIAADSFDVLMGGYRTEALLNYYGTAMAAKRIFFDAGAATEILCRPVVSNYPTYKYFFKTTPYNEWFLAKGVLKIVNTVALGIRAARGLPANATLKAVIISEDLKWAKDEQVPKITAGLPALSISLNATYYVSSTETSSVTAAVTDIIVTKNLTPAIIIPILSGSPGVAYGMTLGGYIAANATGAMSVGIVVYDQIKSPWGAALLTPPPGGPACAYHVGLDTWADGLNQTSKTAAFWAAFAGMIGEYPMYTAATYDASFSLKRCLEAIPSSFNSTTGITTVNGTDIIAWFENPANVAETTTGRPYLYPSPGASPTGLTSAQVDTIYNLTDYGWTYVASQWLVPPHTAHDLAYGVGVNTGLGVQWQWDAGAAKWKKFGVWPRVVGGFNATDQYGDWGFTYAGTQALIIPSYVTSFPWP